MKKTSNFLVPIDFSSCSENALVYAMQLAHRIGANILVLNVPPSDVSDMGNPVSASVIVEEQLGSSRIHLAKTVKKATEIVGETLDEIPSIQTHIEMGRVENTICDVAARNQVDYIMMGTQGENSTLDKYLGSVSSNVLKTAPCPVMVIPDKTVFEKNLVVGYATDFSDAHPFEIWKAMKLFQPFKPNIKCVHFNEKHDDNAGKVQELELYFAETAPGLNIELYSLPVKDKVKDMNNFIEEHTINMLVMYKPKRSFFESVFHESYTQKMARHIHIPLLVFKERK